MADDEPDPTQLPSSPEGQGDTTWDEQVARLRQHLELPLDLPHLDEALTHPSFANEQPAVARDNQRLEFLGDAVLGLCVSELLMESFTHVDEGQLTLMRASLVNAKALARAAREHHVGAALRLGRGADVAGERNRTNVLADVMEALVGAVYLDAGPAKARELTRRVVEIPLERLIAAGGMERDAKSRLQEHAQARGLDAPHYEVVAVEGPPHDRTFTVTANVDGNVAGEGSGGSKKHAEQEAARAALDAIERSG